MHFSPLILGLVALSATAAEPRFLCKPDEQIVFACQLNNKKSVSLCASKNLSATAGYVQYRYGSAAAIELEYPKEQHLPKGTFYISRTAYSGGGASRVRFKIADIDYYLFDSTIRTNFRPGGTNDPVFDAGVVTRQTGKAAAVRRCTTDASNSALAYDRFDAEDFDDDLLP